MGNTPSSMLGGARIYHQLFRMAWSIDEQVTHGEIDNRQKDCLTLKEGGDEY